MTMPDAPTVLRGTLYKYRADNDFTERIFTTGLVWLSTAQQLNDPFECSFRGAPPEWVSQTVLEMKQGQFQGWFEHLYAAVHRGVPFYGLPRQQVVPFLEDLRGRKFDDAYPRLRRFAENASGHTFSDPDRLLEDLEDSRNSLGIFSMADSADNPLMWAHYGGEHQGLCIGFKAAEGTALMDPDRCFPVRYATSLPGFGDDGLLTELRVFADGWSEVVISLSDPTFRAAISTKSPVWSYEREWRYVEPRGGSYEWPAPISEVTFGLRCSAARRRHLLGLVEEYVSGDVEIYDVEKVPDTTTLKRQLSHVVRGRGKADSLRDAGVVIRVGTPRTVGAHIDSLIRNGRYDEALESLTHTLSEAPDTPHVLAQKATTLGLSGAHDEALSIYELLCERFPSTAFNWYQRGVALTALNRLQEAAASYQRALELEPTDASTLFNLGVVLASLGNRTDARRYLTTAIREGHPKAVHFITTLNGSES